VLSTPVPDTTNLKTRITDAFATITKDVLENTCRETDYLIRRSPCNIRSTYLNVLMCYKNVLSYIFKKFYIPPTVVFL